MTPLKVYSNLKIKVRIETVTSDIPFVPNISGGRNLKSIKLVTAPIQSEEFQTILSQGLPSVGLSSWSYPKDTYYK